MSGDEPRAGAWAQGTKKERRVFQKKHIGIFQKKMVIKKVNHHLEVVINFFNHHFFSKLSKNTSPNQFRDPMFF